MTKQFIEDEVNKIVKKYDTTVPIKLAERCGCKLLYAELDGTTLGFSATSHRCHTIIIHDQLSEQVASFVILHELGHIRLHKGISTPFFKKITSNSFIPTIEREANEFAFEVLCRNIENSESLTVYEKLDYLGLSYDLERFI